MSGECRKKWIHCMVGRKSDPNLNYIEGGEEQKRIKRGEENFDYIQKCTYLEYILYFR